MNKRVRGWVSVPSNLWTQQPAGTGSLHHFQGNRTSISEHWGHQDAGKHFQWVVPPECHVCARDSSSRPSLPSLYLARSFLVTIPTTCRKEATKMPKSHS